MNTEEVCAMIDAITEGRKYVYENNGGTSRMTVDEDGISFSAEITFLIEQPRTAREIAGALVAWANRKEGNANEVEAFRVAAEFKPTTSIPEEIVKRQQAVYEPPATNNKVPGCWRADWYRRNVTSMSQETKDRNLKDLRGIWEAGKSTAMRSSTMTKEEASDIYAAIVILRDNGAKGPFDV